MAIVRLDAIGDALALVPLLVSLRRTGARIGVVLSGANAGVFSRNAVDRVHVGASAETIREIARERYGYALIATEDAAGYRLAAAARVPIRIGFENGWGKPFKSLWVRRLCTRTVHRTAGLDPRGPHECEVLFRLGSPLVYDAQPPREAALLRPFVLDAPAPFDDRIALQVTDKWERFGVPLDRVAELARALSESAALRLIGSAREAEYARTFERATGMGVELFDNIGPWKAAIASARTIVAPDSGATHVAGMTGTPVVALFPAERFALQKARWAPWAAPYAAIALEGDWIRVAVDAALELFNRRSATYLG